MELPLSLPDRRLRGARPSSLLGLSDAEIEAGYERGAVVEGQDLPPELTEG
jgi:hypothetical protein